VTQAKPDKRRLDFIKHTQKGLNLSKFGVLCWPYQRQNQKNAEFIT